jgi:hypothetical protein
MDQPNPIPPIIATPALAKPKVLLYYKLCCGLLALIWLGMAISFFLIGRGKMDPPLSFAEELAVKQNSSVRERAAAEERAQAPGVCAACCAAMLFYIAAIFVPRRQWGWIAGVVAIAGMALPMLITVVFTIVLAIQWVKPETRRYFSS